MIHILRHVTSHTTSTHLLIRWIKLISPHTDMVMTYHVRLVQSPYHFQRLSHTLKKISPITYCYGNELNIQLKGMSRMFYRDFKTLGVKISSPWKHSSSNDTV